MSKLLKKQLLMILLFCGLLAAPAWAKSDETVSEVATIPFAPELNVDLIYNVTTEKPGGRIATIKQKLMFSEADDGYILMVTPLAITIGGVTQAISEVPSLAEMMPGFLNAMRYDIAQDGTVIGVRNWDEEKLKISQSRDNFGTLIAEQEEDEDKISGNKIANEVIDFFLRMTPEQAANYYLNDWVPVLGYGGAEVELDQEYEMETELEYNGAQVPAIAYVLLTEDKEKNALKLVEKTSLLKRKPGENIFDDVEGLLGGAFEGDEKKREQLREAMTELEKAEIDNSVEILFQADTGMPIEASVSKSITLPSGETSKTSIRIEKVSE